MRYLEIMKVLKFKTLLIILKSKTKSLMKGIAQIRNFCQQVAQIVITLGPVRRKGRKNVSSQDHRNLELVEGHHRRAEERLVVGGQSRRRVRECLQEMLRTHRR